MDIRMDGFQALLAWRRSLLGLSQLRWAGLEPSPQLGLDQNKRCAAWGLFRCPSSSLLGEGSPTKTDYIKKVGTRILFSLLEDLVGFL